MQRYEILFRIILTFILSFAFGLERQRSHKPVGFGTYIFVSVGGCALAITALNLSPDNPLSLLGAIVSGIGFLGAGALIKTTDKIFGFTTAASIWVFSILGLVIGTGEYFIATLIYISIWLIIIFDKQLERRGIGSYQKKVVINTNRIISEKDIRKILFSETKKHTILSLDVDKKNNRLSITYMIQGSKDHLNKIPARLHQEPWFDSCHIE
jgi:putative Mg2+ transporter-C (MgtC) family protein